MSFYQENLYQETVKAIEDAGMTPDDVIWVGSGDVLLDTESFWRCARATEYDAGFGAQKIASDLIVMLNDGSWLRRSEYDGAEEWKLVRGIDKPKSEPVECVALDADSVGLVGWESLESILHAARGERGSE